MRATDFVAWVGASTGVASLFWNIYSKITANRPKVVVKAYANMIQMPPPPNAPKDLRFLRMTVQNIGTATTTLTNVEFFRTIPKWQRFLTKFHFKKRANETRAVLNLYSGPQLPHKLEVGSEWVGLMVQDEEFEDWLKTERLYCAMHHSFALRPVAKKIIRGPV